MTMMAVAIVVVAMDVIMMLPYQQYQFQRVGWGMKKKMMIDDDDDCVASRRWRQLELELVRRCDDALFDE